MNDQVSASSDPTSPCPLGTVYFLSTFTGTMVPYQFGSGGTALAQDDPHVLFYLQEYEGAFGELFGEVIESKCQEKSPVLRELVTAAPGERVRTQRITTPTGEAISIEPTKTAMEYYFEVNDIERFDLDALEQQCDAVAETLADAKLDHLLSATGRIAEGLGQATKGAGQKFGWPVILTALEVIEIEFSDDGQPVLPRMVAAANKRHFLEYPPLTREYQPAFDRLMDRKRAEFDARRRRR